jgi:hypothetical protein
MSGKTMWRALVFGWLLIGVIACGQAAAKEQSTATPPPDQPATLPAYFLPAGFPAGYVLAETEPAASPTGFTLALRRADVESTVETMLIAGGEPAASTVRENVADPNATGALIKPITVRGQNGTWASGGFGATYAWVENGVPYYVVSFDPEPASLDFINSLETVDLETWQARVAAAR